MPFIDVGGVALRYEASGSGDRSLVLIHEMASSLEAWDGVVPLIRDGYRILRFDMRGFGMSEKVRGEASIDALSDDVFALAEALALPERPVIVGSAVGGAVALNCAARHPASVSGVVAIGPATGIDPSNRKAVLDMADAIERGSMRERVTPSMDGAYPVALRKDEASFANFRARWLGGDPGSFAATYRMLAKLDLDAALGRIDCPVLLVAGTLDPFRPPEFVQTLAGKIPGAKVSEIESGHFAADQTPALVAATINWFLEEIGR